MKFLHAHTEVTSRAKTKKTAVASAAYRYAIGKYAAKQNQLISTKVCFPAGCPFQDILDSQFLWQLVDEKEKRKDAQLFREFQADFHNDLSIEEQEKTLQQFIKQNFTRYGMIADYAIHKNDKGYHFHIMLTMRKLNKKAETPLQLFGEKDRDWNDKSYVALWRQEWENKLNDLATQYNKEKVSFKTFDEEFKAAVEKEDFLLAAEIKIKQETARAHKSRPQYAQFRKNSKKAKKDFEQALQAMKKKQNEEKEELNKNILKIAQNIATVHQKSLNKNSLSKSSASTLSKALALHSLSSNKNALSVYSNNHSLNVGNDIENIIDLKVSKSFKRSP